MSLALFMQRAVGFPEGLKSVKLSKGNYANVFPEAMETQVVRVPIDGTLQFQSIPLLLPAYNKYIGWCRSPPSSEKNLWF